MTKHVHAVIRCSICGHVSHGAPIRLPASKPGNASREEALEVLRRAVQGLVMTLGDDLECPGCRTRIFQQDAKLLLVYDDLETTAH